MASTTNDKKVGQKSDYYECILKHSFNTNTSTLIHKYIAHFAFGQILFFSTYYIILKSVTYNILGTL